MQQSQEKIALLLEKTNSLLSEPFWTHIDFWISIIVGIAGLYFSVRAFIEAGAARRAAMDAGRTVKIQTVAIELSEVAQKLEAIEPDISFGEARNLLSEISRRLRRVISPFADDPALSSAISALRESLDVAQESLRSVRPTQSASDGGLSTVVYYGIESDFANINNLVADLIGLLEKRTIGLGDSNVNA